jgi:hypothetical protein
MSDLKSPMLAQNTNSPSSEQRVSTLVGDRLCIGCGYNLSGQAVLRESIYNMLIVRCPECGIVASVQEYPLLGRWANRWAFVFAAVWFITLLIFLMATAGILFGVSQTSIESASAKYATWLGVQQLEWLKQQQPTGNPNFGWMQSQPLSPYTTVDPTWWAAQDPNALLASQGGWSAMVDRNFGWTWANWSPLLITLGCFWSVALLQLRRRGLVLFALVPIGLAAVLSYMFGYGPNSMLQMYGWSYMITHASAQIGPRMVVITLVFSWLMMCAGLLVGRSVLRGLVRLLLPPRLRSSLAGLWMTDGLAPPK